jgi:hypothetical protein
MNLHISRPKASEHRGDLFKRIEKVGYEETDAGK